MSEQSSQSVVVQPSDVRFSIRALLVVMVGVAIAAAALGPYFRGLKPSEREPVGVLWAVCTVFTLTWIGFHARARYRLERQAGRTILALTARGRRIREVRPWATVAGGCLMIVFGLYYLVAAGEELIDARSVRSKLFSIGFRGAFSGVLISWGVVTIWWKQRTQLRELGVLRGLHMLPWTHVTSCKCEDGAVVLEGIDQRHQDIWLAMNVPGEQREAVESLLASKLFGLSQPSAGVLPGMSEPPYHAPTIKVTPNDIVSGRRLFRILCVYVVLLIMGAVLAVGTPPEEFYFGAGFGLFCAVLASVRQRERIGAAGRPLIRLPLRVDWLRTAGAVMLLLVCYFATEYVDVASPVLAAVLGCVSGVCVFAIFGAIMRENVDLCENGVVIYRTSFWPWNKTRLVKWDRERGRRLVLGNGWRRVIAGVSQAEREAVDALLTEKLGAGNPQ